MTQTLMKKTLNAVVNMCNAKHEQTPHDMTILSNIY